MFNLKSTSLSVFILTATGCAALADTTTNTAQQLLNQLGYNAGPVDGSYGRKTRTALEAFYAGRGSAFDGVLDQNELDDLRAAAGIERAVRPAVNLRNVDRQNRGDVVDCRDHQRGVGGIDNPAINADWYLNNDFGYYTWGQNGGSTPDLKSCIYRDGSGWVFDSGKAYFPSRFGNRPIEWFAPAVVVGAKGFHSIGNMYNSRKEFPVRVGDIEKLDYSVEYEYQLRGSGNTHIGLWFSHATEPQFEGDPSAGVNSIWTRTPDLEVMLTIGDNRDPHWRTSGCLNDNRRGHPTFNYPGVFKSYGCFETPETEATRGTRPNGSGYGSLSIWMEEGLGNKQNGYHNYDFDLEQLINEMVREGLVTEDQYLMGIEFQTEIVYGKGEMLIHSLDYELVTR